MATEQSATLSSAQTIAASVKSISIRRPPLVTKLCRGTEGPFGIGKTGGILKNDIPINLTMADIAMMCGEPIEIIDRLARCRICPAYVWKSKMSQPRWHPNTIGQWLRILEDVDLDSLPLNPPPLQRPTEVFRDRGPTKKELALVRKVLGIRESEKSVHHRSAVNG
jgi:hypothetical protein